MNIGIIGSGSAGRTLAKGFAQNQHAVLLGTRNRENAELKEWADAHHVALGTLEDAARHGEVIVLATPWSNGATENAVRLAGLENFAGKAVMDATNPLVLENGKLQLALGWNTSGGEMVQRWLPGARVVKAFNTVGAETMIHAARAQGTPDMFLAGDDAGAKNTIGALAREFGWDVVDAGDLTQARLLEPLALLWINYARTNKTRAHAFKLLKH